MHTNTGQQPDMNCNLAQELVPKSTKEVDCITLVWTKCVQH